MAGEKLCCRNERKEGSYFRVGKPTEQKLYSKMALGIENKVRNNMRTNGVTGVFCSLAFCINS